jgi:hypothetical protein
MVSLKSCFLIKKCKSFIHRCKKKDFFFKRRNGRHSWTQISSHACLKVNWLNHTSILCTFLR